MSSYVSSIHRIDPKFRMSNEQRFWVREGRDIRLLYDYVSFVLISCEF